MKRPAAESALESTQVPAAILSRKGSRDTAGVPSDVRAWLEAGRIETVNLSEWLVVDQGRLAERVLAEHGWENLVPRVHAELAALKTNTAPKRLEAVGRALGAEFGEGRKFEVAHKALRGHRSDIVRSWSAYMVGLNPGALKDDPSPGLAVLEPLRSDPSLYVRNSVGNWLNDASKSRPDWVEALCARWRKESPTNETTYIIRRALRTLRKGGPSGPRP